MKQSDGNEFAWAPIGTIEFIVSDSHSNTTALTELTCRHSPVSGEYRDKHFQCANESSSMVGCEQVNKCTLLFKKNDNDPIVLRCIYKV